MKILNKETKTVIETTDKEAIARFKRYPDKFDFISDDSKKKTKKSSDDSKKEND